MSLFKKTVAVAGGSAAALVFTATAAMAAPVYTTVGGSTGAGTTAVTGTNSGSITFDDLGQPMSCSSSSITGTVTAGVEVKAGNTIGSVTNLTFSSCTATTLAIPVTVSKAGTANWAIVATGVPNADRSVPIQIQGISANVAGTACNFGATGTVAGKFVPGTSASAAGQIVINTGAVTPLNISVAGSGITCGGYVYDGDTASMVGTFNLADTAGAIDWA